MQYKCRVVQILGSSEMCDKFGLKTKETSWPDADYRSYFIFVSLNMLLLQQGKSGTERGGAAVPCNLTDACCKVRRTLKYLLTFHRTPNGTFLIR